MNELHTLQTRQGALFEQSLAVSFGNDDAALTAIQQEEGLAIADRSHWTWLHLTGADRQSFLHNQTTNQIQQLQPGQGCETVFVNSTGRTLDLATVCAGAEALDVIASPGQGGALMTWLDRYLFPADRVELQNRTGELALFSVFGQPDLPGLGALDPQAVGSHCELEIAGVAVRAIAGTGLSGPGYTLQVPPDAAATVWAHLTEQQGALPLGQTAWERLRILDGRPLPGAELTPDYNALEAGLWRAISFNKGCYIGQEIIARLNTYQGVKQRLWGLRLSEPVAVGTLLMQGDKKVGRLTSISPEPGSERAIAALGYLRTRAGGPGSTLQVGEVMAQVCELPFVKHEYHTNTAP
ncbi:MAG: folate-binding protein [Cyanobacteria bacterium P01_G01_bin.54]